MRIWKTTKGVPAGITSHQARLGSQPRDTVTENPRHDPEAQNDVSTTLHRSLRLRTLMQEQSLSHPRTARSAAASRRHPETAHSESDDSDMVVRATSAMKTQAIIVSLVVRWRSLKRVGVGPFVWMVTTWTASGFREMGSLSLNSIPGLSAIPRLPIYQSSLEYKSVRSYYGAECLAVVQILGR